jgi:hypothetical protein
MFSVCILFHKDLAQFNADLKKSKPMYADYYLKIKSA